MLPATPLHHLLLELVATPLVATSGNLSDEPICTDEHEAAARLGHIADLLLMHNRPIARHVDDSIAWVVDGAPQLLRRARGYAPLPLMVEPVEHTGTLPILGVGAHQKNSVALSVPGEGDTPVFISQHIGDLASAPALDAFERVIADFQRLYATHPRIIAHDMHPDYLSTRWAQQQAAASTDITLHAVQHHHAHFAACLAEHRAQHMPALGAIWDGSGYGPDGTVWGGEFLHGTAAHADRIAHLRTFGLPGGEAAVREPRRVALALLWEMGGDDALEAAEHLDTLESLRSFTPAERHVLARMLRSGAGTPRTSSAGRLFDGVAALLGLCQQATYEGQAAVRLEHATDTTETSAYPLTVAGAQIDWEPLIAALLHDLRRGTPTAIMAARAHNALVDAIVAVALLVGEPHVVLSGGCFQNRLLTERSAERLRDHGFEVLTHRLVPPNDGGISLGQVVVAAAAAAAQE